MRSIRGLKKLAKQAMMGNTGMLVLAMVAYAVLSFAGTALTDLFFPGTGMENIVLSEIFLFILTLVLGVFYAGVRLLYLNAARGREYSMENLIYFFRNDPDKVIVAAFATAVISLVVSVPAGIYLYRLDRGTTASAQLEEAAVSLGVMLLVTAVSELLTLPLELTYYLMADHPELSGTGALKKSVTMMRGSIGRLFLLKISFIPLMLLSVFTLYLALIWIIPYMEMATVEFYRELTGELGENESI